MSYLSRSCEEELPGKEGGSQHFLVERNGNGSPELLLQHPLTQFKQEQEIKTLNKWLLPGSFDNPICKARRREWRRKSQSFTRAEVFSSLSRQSRRKEGKRGMMEEIPIPSPSDRKRLTGGVAGFRRSEMRHKSTAPTPASQFFGRTQRLFPSDFSRCQERSFPLGEKLIHFHPSDISLFGLIQNRILKF